MKIYKHTNNENGRSGAARRNSAAAIIARLAICMMLTAAMVIPMAVPADVFAAASSTTTTSSSTTTYTTSKTRSMAGLDLVFDQKVITNKDLKYSPTHLRVTGRLTSIALKWTAVTKPSKIKGYIIVRRDLDSNTWREIAKVDANTTFYADKDSIAKNKFYRYSVLAYKKTDGKILVSSPAGWAGALTALSTKKNIYSVKLSNEANMAVIRAGSCAQMYLKYRNKAYSKYFRYWTSNSSIATVSSSGLVRGVNPGNVYVYCKTHTGRIASFKVKIVKGGTAQAMIDTFNAWLGYSRINGKQKGIIDIYNSMTPWPVGYKMKYSDAWCDATVTAAAIKTGCASLIGRECSVPRHVSIFQKKGIWIENGKITPKPGDIIVYSWRKFSQPNNASPSHIGIVAKVEGKTITAIEGNRGIGVVATRTIPVGWGCIRGYARPNYKK